MQLTMTTSSLNFFIVICFLGFGCPNALGFDSQQGKPLPLDSAVMSFQGPLRNAQLDMELDSGYHVPTADMSTPYLVFPDVQRVFGAESGLRKNPPAALPAAFDHMTLVIKNYMVKITGSRSTEIEKANRISYGDLAKKVVRLSFCFGTDPYYVANQIKAESTFERHAESTTGAVGFSEMTGSGIDEVNDQLGNRGERNANLQDIQFLDAAIRCYQGSKPFIAMFQAGVIPQGARVSNQSTYNERAKRWLGQDVDRDLVYGQIALKTYLGVARYSGCSGRSAYQAALQDYNGDHKNGEYKRYAQTIMAGASILDAGNWN